MSKVVTANLNDQALLEQMRADCINSLYVFAKVACGFDKFNERVHKPWADFLQHNKSIRKILLAPRDHFKSSLTQAYVLWRIVRNPEERILVASDTAGTAQNKLEILKATIESPRFQALFPHIKPSKTDWSSESFSVQRKGAYGESTVTANGSKGARAGAHYTLILCDDLATKEAAEQPTTMQRIKDWADNSENMLVEPYTHEIIVIGTIWTHSDVHEHLIKAWQRGNKPDQETPFFSYMRVAFFNEQGDVLFPELYGGEENARDYARRQIETNPYLWFANMMNSPQIPDAEFQMEDIRFFRLVGDDDYIMVEKKDGSPKIVPIAACDIYITVDPAFKKSLTASKAAICVSAVAPDGDVYVLESIGQRGGTYALNERIGKLVSRFRGNLRALGVESVGQQQAYIDFLQAELRQKGEYIRVDPMPPGSTKDKPARIRTLLQPYFAKNKVFLRENQAGLLDEMSKFPLDDIRDELDALAYAAQYYWDRVPSARSEETYRTYVDEFMKAREASAGIAGY